MSETGIFEAGDRVVCERAPVEFPARVRAPASWKLLANAPNPFNPFTTIRFEVPAGGGEVRLEIFDVRGGRVQLLEEGFRKAGVHELTWRADERLGSGLYFCKLSASGFEQTEKMLLIK